MNTTLTAVSAPRAHHRANIETSAGCRSHFALATRH